MKANQPFVPNKKLILHFDIDGVLRLPARKNKDLYVYDLCAEWVWGKLQRNNKQDPDLVTGWKLAQNTLAKQQPEPELVSYKQYLKQYSKPDAEEWEKLILNLSKGPASKAKSEIQKTIKNITIPKPLYQILKEQKQANNDLQRNYIADGKYEILPAFYKMFLNLKKSKRQFAIIIKCNNQKLSHIEIINELNLFFLGSHPLYNGQNGTPAVKMDGTNKSKNFVFEDSHFCVLYHAAEGQFISSFGTQNFVQERDVEMLKQTLKSNKKIKVCQNIGQIYSFAHSILSQSALIYELNPDRIFVIDSVDYLTHQIYFTNQAEHVEVYSVTAQKISKVQSFVEKVDQFEYLRDVDYFIKKIEQKQLVRAQEIQRIQKGQEAEQQPQEENVEDGESKKQQKKQDQISDAEYLKRNIVPVLDAALRQVDLFRPEDPIGFIALYCLKNKERLE